MKKHLIRFLLVLAVCLLPAAAAALDAGELYWLEFPFWDEETEAADLGLPEDSPIPLFAAPFDEALPLEPIPAGETFLLKGTLQAQTWAMAETADARTGWIRIDPDACELPYEDDLEIRRMLCRVTAKAGVSAGFGEQTLCTLQEGDTVIVMFVSEDSGLAYAETGVDGQIAWLFTDADALEGVELVEVEGNTVRVREGVTILGEPCSVTWTEVKDEEGEWDAVTFLHTVIRPGDIADSGIDLIMLLGMAGRLNSFSPTACGCSERRPLFPEAWMSCGFRKGWKSVIQTRFTGPKSGGWSFPRAVPRISRTEIM